MTRLILTALASCSLLVACGENEVNKLSTTPQNLLETSNANPWSATP